jgi:energy-converting hydrogenase Eha subunit B
VQRIVTLSLIVLTCGCSHEPPTGPTRGSFSISGRVVDYRTQAPIAGGRVEFNIDGSPTLIASSTTDASGSYVLTVPASGTFVVTVNGSIVGVALVNRPTYRGDLLVNGADCASRYGTLTDARTARPVAGATVTLAGGTATSDADGWYRIDLGCPASTGFGTTFLSVTHPDYAATQRVAGRGVQGVSRLDVELERRRE